MKRIPILLVTLLVWLFSSMTIYAQDPFYLVIDFRVVDVSFEEITVEIVIENQGFSDEPILAPVVADTEWGQFIYETEPITGEARVTSISIPVPEGVTGPQFVRIEIDREENSDLQFQGSNIFETEVDIPERPVIDEISPQELIANEEQTLTIFGSDLGAFLDADIVSVNGIRFELLGDLEIVDDNTIMINVFVPADAVSDNYVVELAGPGAEELISAEFFFEISPVPNNEPEPQSPDNQQPDPAGNISPSPSPQIPEGVVIVIVIAGVVVTVGGGGLIMAYKGFQLIRRNNYQKKASKKDPPKRCIKRAWHCKLAKLELHPKRWRVVNIYGVMEDRKYRIVKAAAITKSLNAALKERRRRRTRQDQFEKHLYAAVQMLTDQIQSWRENKTKDVRFVVDIAGGTAEFTYELYRCKGRPLKMVKVASWKKKVSATDAGIGTVAKNRSIDDCNEDLDRYLVATIERIA